MNFTLPQATTDAAEVDHLILALTLASCAILLLVFGLIWIYAIRYRADSKVERGAPGEKSWRFEISWTLATLVVFLGLFVWGADLYVRLFQPPTDALRIYVVGKQWMWKIEHQGGQREINALHVPTGRPVQLLMTSEDVIHDFAIPAFRIKHDVLPGRYETLWFTAKRPGTYHLYCTQLCGEGHASMIGEVVAMTAPDFQNWLENGGGASPAPQLSMAASGEALYQSYGCVGCHGVGGVNKPGEGVTAPSLAGISGTKVKLEGGAVVVADEHYLRDCILAPDKTRVAGYAPIMPSFAGQVSEENALRLIAYIKSLKAKDTP